MKTQPSKKELVIAAQKYAKKYIGSPAAGTKETDEQEWVAEYVSQLDQFNSLAGIFDLLNLFILPNEE